MCKSSVPLKFVLSIVSGIIFIIIFIPAQSYTQELNPLIFNLNNLQTLIRDSKESNDPIELPETIGDLRAVVNFGIGVGHHDNITKAKSWTRPKVEKTNLTSILHIEVGANYKRVSGILFVVFELPIPGSKVISGYEHSSGFGELGVLFNLRILPLQSKLNINPILGHKGLRETLRISDFDAKTPDSLNSGYGDNGMLFGIDLEFAFLRKIRSEHRLAFRYLHENLRRPADRYRVEWRGLGFMTDKEGMIHFDEFGYLSIGFEMAKLFEDRKEWFIIVSLGAEIK